MLVGCQVVVLAAIGGLVTAPTPALAGRGATADGCQRDDGVSPAHLLSARSDGRIARARDTQPPHGVSRAVGLLPELAAPPLLDAPGATSHAEGARSAVARTAVPRSSRGPPGA